MRMSGNFPEGSSDCFGDSVILKDFRSGVNQQDVYGVGIGEFVSVQTPGLPDSASDEISFDRSFEDTLGNRNDEPWLFTPCGLKIVNLEREGEEGMAFIMYFLDGCHIS